MDIRVRALPAVLAVLAILVPLAAGCADDNNTDATPTPGSGGFHSTTKGNLSIGFETARASPDDVAVMFELTNDSFDVDDSLTGASSDVSASSELQTVDPDGVAETVPRIEVPANQTLQMNEFQVVLTELTSELSKGDMIALTLEFEKAGAFDLEVEVSELTAP